MHSVFPSLLFLLQPLIKLYKSKHNESKLHLMAIMQYGILTLQPGFCSTHHLAIVGDRQDLCVFHVLRKKRTKPLMLYCLGFQHSWSGGLCFIQVLAGMVFNHMLSLSCCGYIFFCVCLFIDEKSWSKQAQNVMQHGKESEVRHYYRQAGWNFILSAYPSNYFFKTAHDICQGV